MRKTGVGQKVSVSLYNSMLAMQMQEAAMIMMADSEVNWAAMPLSGVFDTQDGALVLVGAFKANPLQDICKALDLPDLSADPKFCNLNQQFKHKAELQAHVPPAVRQQHPRPLAGAGWRSRTCCARRCATCARPWSTRRRCTTRC